MPRALIACHSYTLIKPGTSEKITVKRGQTIDHLDEADQKYLSRQTMTPPSVDDSHLPPMRTPIFHEIVKEDSKGEAQTEPFNLNVDGSTQAGAAQRVEPVQVQVVVSPDAGVKADAAVVGDDEDADAGDDGDAAGDADGGGGAEEAPAAAAPPAPKQEKKRQSKARNKA